jgi:hypothetical protein
MLFRMKSFSLFFAVIFALISVSANAERWNAMNSPSIMAEDFVYHLDALPTKGSLDVQPWSETYWASKKGSINLRWNQERPVGFKTESPSKSQAARMTREELARLAPSEKYDLFMGRYQYPLKKEVDGIATPMAKWWSGLCDGWSLAAIQYAEPKPVELMNPDGILIPFGASDIKGLMSYAAARRFNVSTHQVGGRCSGVGRILSTPGCQDINAGSLHVIFANMIGLRKQGFVTEIDPGNQIWNQPTFAYEYEITGSAKSDAGATGVRVHARLFYSDELEESSWQPVVGTEKNAFDKLEMDYILDLDLSGRIIGGRYVGGQRPDFVWLPTNRLEFKDDLDGINQLIQGN